jgi:hypothetical protein
MDYGSRLSFLPNFFGVADLPITMRFSWAIEIANEMKTKSEMLL